MGWYVAQALNTGNAKLSTPLTQRNRSQGRDGIRKKTPAPAKVRVAAKPICSSCGDSLAGGNRKFCDNCLPEHHAEKLSLLKAAGVRALEKARENGEDPAHGGNAAVRRADTQKNRHEQRREYESDGLNLEAERERFVRDIQPRLTTARLSSIMNATGLSIRYASLIKTGKRIPHPVHYIALEELVSGLEKTDSICPEID